MKNKILKIGMLILSLVILVLVCGFTNPSAVTSMKNVNSGNGDYNSPVCFVDLEASVRIGKVRTGAIICSDESKIVDSDIDISDVVVAGGIIKKVKILSFYDKMTPDNGKTYYWKFNYKGILLGKSNIYLRANAVFDEYGNANWPSQTKTIRIKLFG